MVQEHQSWPMHTFLFFRKRVCEYINILYNNSLERFILKMFHFTDATLDLGLIVNCIVISTYFTLTGSNLCKYWPSTSRHDVQLPNALKLPASIPSGNFPVASNTNRIWNNLISQFQNMILTSGILHTFSCPECSSSIVEEISKLLLIFFQVKFTLWSK